MSVGALINREERPAYVRFERRPVEDKAASLREGRYVARDVDFALVTPPYSKDCVEYRVERWIQNIEKNVRDERIPAAWAEQWKEMYRRWQNGQEMPLNGTPIKGWGVISPAQQEMLIAINILTVEDLALINDEGRKRIGMGSLELRDKAKNWLASVKDHGGLTIQMASLENENRTLKATIESQQEALESLRTQVEALSKIKQPVIIAEERGISADDILEDEAPPVQRKAGRPKRS